MPVRLFHRRYLYAVSVILLSVILLLIVWRTVRENERTLAITIFDSKMKDYAKDIQNQIDQSTGVVESIGSFFNASVFVERDEFAKFVEAPLLRYAQIRALNWVPAVRDRDRDRYEELARADGMKGFQFTERVSQGVMRRAGRRPWYFPVYYRVSLQENRTALGFDLRSDPARLETLQRSIETGKMASSGRLTLVQETGDIYGFLIIRPIYQAGISPVAPEDPMSDLQGFALGVFSITDLVAEAIKGRNLESIGFYLFDDSAPPGRRFLYDYNATGGVHKPESFYGVPDAVLQGVHYRTNLSIPGRAWSVLFYPTPGHYGQNFGESSMILTGGLIFIGLLCVFLWTTMRHAQKIEGLLEERRKVEANLHESLQEKEILLKEIHHRVKNNLQMVSGLLNLQGRHAGDETVRDLYRESENRVMSMALIHENLYNNRDLGRINFANYVRSLVGSISSSYRQEEKEIGFIFDLEEGDLVIDTAIPAGLIINELITNAYKHAFSGRQDGEVRIAFHGSKGSGYVLTVADNGVGMPAGRDPGSFSSLGLNLVRTLVELLGGRLEIHRENGTMFRITFGEYREAGTELH